ncbi:MAG: tRNA (5-methylaminomethyl-2-thiouridine)(34)-methyltransferase MnmD [Candidatus Symbiothrix sp.]|jgi:tRNA U34 5-methylaminomethyl-2-thiouridine-forming methyltransferase MnmC|nr:tRNA (5-methylaminomethyl-2-thiouridine)(34)-methyltransferase MnmD [Candidatus Symbiothrix sp.]
MKIQQTADGSPTLYLPEIDEHYHSVHGAVQESQHVYLDAGFNQSAARPVRVLEMGFGTGLNVLLTALEAERRSVPVIYTALEKYPLPPETTNQLDYTVGDRSLFQAIHRAKWGEPTTLMPCFSLKKIETDFNAFDYSEPYDVVYYDAFAPDKQPEVWSQALFDALFAAMNAGGVLTTYCAKGVVRRMMLQSGFQVERIAGPAGKREMLRARKCPNEDR